MQNAPVTASASGGRPGIPQRVLLSGIALGLLLGGFALTLPERVRYAALCLGIGLMLACTGIMAAHLSRGTDLEWRGISPAIAILIGALLGFGPFIWHYVEARYDQTSRQAAVVSAPLPRVQATRWVSAPLPQLPVAETQHENNPAGDLGRSLDDIAQVVNGGRPAIQAVLQSAFPSRINANVAAGRLSQLATATRELSDLQRSVEQLRSRNGSSSQQLSAILGDTSPLGELNSSLPPFTDALAHGSSASEGALDPLPQLAQKVRADASRANQWIAECNQRIAELRTSGGSTPGRL